MSHNNCVVPKVRKNVWSVYDAISKEKIGEVAAQSETEARIYTCRQIMIPFTLKQDENVYRARKNGNDYRGNTKW